MKNLTEIVIFKNNHKKLLIILVYIQRFLNEKLLSWDSDIILRLGWDNFKSSPHMKFQSLFSLEIFREGIFLKLPKKNYKLFFSE